MPPTIFFATNTGSQSTHADGIQRIYAEINTPSFTSQFRIIRCISNNSIEVLQQLHIYQNEITFFYFGGRDEHFQALVDASFRDRLGSLFEYLARLRYLDLIFLSYCSREMYVQPLLQGGTEAVIGTSHHLPHAQTLEFATVFCQQFLTYGVTTQVAYHQAIHQAGILPDTQERQLAGLHGNPHLRLRRWWDNREFEQNSRIVGTEETAESRIIGEPAISDTGLPPLPAPLQPPVDPFPGAQPYFAKYACVFFGREAELLNLYNHLTTVHQQPIILLYGQSGVGKSSLLRAGLLPRLHVRYFRFYYNGRKTPQLFAALCRRIQPSDHTRITKQDWTTWLNGQNRDLLLTIDQFEAQLLSNSTQVQTDLAQLMDAIRILISGPASRNRPRVIFCVREENLVQFRELLTKYQLQRQTHEFRLQPLTENGIRSVLHSFAPSSVLATHYQFVIGDDVAERTVTDLTQDQHSSIAPFLQAILENLWEEATAATPRQPSLPRYQQRHDSGELFRDFLDARLTEIGKQWPPIPYRKLITLLTAYTSLAVTASEKAATAKGATQPITYRLNQFSVLMAVNSRHPPPR